MTRKIISFFSRKDVQRHLIRYVCVGGSSFCGEYLIFTLLNLSVGSRIFYPLGITVTGLFIANTVSYFIAFWYCFFLNRIWTFRSSGNVFKQLGLYILLFVVNMILSNILIHFMSFRLGIAAQIGKILATFIVSLWNFFAYRFIFSLE